MSEAPHRIVAIDWSGRVDAPGQRRHIYAASWTAAEALPPTAQKRAREHGRAGVVQLTNGRTRDETATWLIDLSRSTPRMVVGFDFCFSFPEWFVQGEHGCSTGPEFWRLVNEQHGERWLAPGQTDPRFWGKPGKRPAEFSGHHLHRMLRAADINCKLTAYIPDAERAARIRGITPKSVFQIGGSGSVGTASLRGMPILLRLRRAGFRVWPFDQPQLSGATPAPLVVEMYSRLNTGPVHKSNPSARAAYLLAKRNSDATYTQLSPEVLRRARRSEDAFDALVSCMAMVEHRSTFAHLPPPLDPKYVIEGWTWAP